MASKIVEKTITAPSGNAGPSNQAIAQVSGDEMIKFKLFGINIFVLFALLIVIGIVGYFVYKYFFTKSEKTQTQKPQVNTELDQVHAWYQEQLSLQEQEYRKRLEQMSQAGTQGDSQQEEESREIEIEDESDNQDDEPSQDEEHLSVQDNKDELRPNEPDQVKSEEQKSEDSPPIRIEINDTPKEVKVIRRGKKKGQTLDSDEYAKRAARLMIP